MTQKPLDGLSIPQLQQQRKQLKGILVAFGIMALLLLALIIRLIMLHKPVFALTAILMSFVPLSIPMVSLLRQVNTELSKRDTNASRDAKV